MQTLREHASRLEAALSVGLARPKPKAVHALRSETRRIEAQLELLEMLHGLPAFRAEADKVLRRLKKLRGMAGKVRDCDVHRKLLKNGAAEIASAPEAPKGIAKDGDRLRKVLEQQREREEGKLLKTITKQQPKLARDVEDLLDALQAGEAMEAPPEVLRQIERKFGEMVNSDGGGEQHLHEVRKLAKRARYQCESLPGEEAQAMAQRFEAMQDAGGAWHDLLDLACRAHEEFGPDHPLSRVLEHRRDQHLDQYAEMLERFRAEHPAPKSHATSHADGQPRKRGASARKGSKGSKAAKKGSAGKSAQKRAQKGAKGSSAKRARAR